MVQGKVTAHRKSHLEELQARMEDISGVPKNQPFPVALQSVPWEGRRSVPQILSHGWEHKDNGVAPSLALGPNSPSTGVVAHTLFALAMSCWVLAEENPWHPWQTAPKHSGKQMLPQGIFMEPQKPGFLCLMRRFSCFS